jgi:hypothetical protein
MTPVNGHANGDAVTGEPVPSDPRVNTHIGMQLDWEEIRRLTTELEVPFEPTVIEWRVTNTSKNGSPRGQVIPYADQRAYTDRLNAVFTPAGWTREYTVHTSANFERSKDKKIVAKVLVTCKLTIFRLGSHSATGEEWADDENAGTSAEAQAFKRAASCFGLGRYLYYFSGEWVDLDDRKRPKRVPKLPMWATPDGWRQGLRPQQSTGSRHSVPMNEKNAGAARDRQSDGSEAAALVREIEAFEEPLGKGIYRGLLKTVARAWKANQIRDTAVLERVLAHMQAAKRGLLRLDSALNTLGTESLLPVLRALNLRSLDNVDNLDTLKEIVLALEEAAAKTRP